MPAPRPLSAIDAELRNMLTLQHDAEQQLDTLRRRQTELAAHELAVMRSVDMRADKIDRLLEERSTALEVPA